MRKMTVFVQLALHTHVNLTRSDALFNFLIIPTKNLVLNMGCLDFGCHFSPIVVGARASPRQHFY